MDKIQHVSPKDFFIERIGILTLVLCVYKAEDIEECGR